MLAAGNAAPKAETSKAGPGPLGELMLIRIACRGGATRAELLADLGPFFQHKLSPAEWRKLADVAIAGLVAGGLAADKRGRLTAIAGAPVPRLPGLGAGEAPEWSDVRDIALVAWGLGLDKEPASRLKVLRRPEGLRAAILQSAYRLPPKKNPSPAKLRAQLALVALERAFGNKIKTGFGKGSAFTAKAGRTLAGQLSLNPRDFGSDDKLIAQLAAEHVGAVQPDLEQLRSAIFRKLGAQVLSRMAAAEARVTIAAPKVAPQPANDRGPSAPERAARPGPEEFARAVQAAARQRAEGWPGNRKAFISHVWQAIRARETQWALTEIEFKCMLAEAHRLGHVMLANADLKDKKNLSEFESSAIAYKNTVWHFVRVED